MGVTAAEAAIQALRREGITHVFGLAGTTTLHLLDALGREPDIRFVSVRHEQAAGYMADGFARASGGLAACLVSRGPGAANLIVAMHNAYGESVPVLAIVGQVDDAIVHRDAFEEVDLVTLFEPVTKWSLEVHAPERVAELVQRAAHVAVTGRPRPVMVSLPLDVQAREVADPGLRPAFAVADPVPPEDEIARAAALLAAGRRPVLLVGGGAERSGARDATAALAEWLGAPVVASWHRKAAFPDWHPHFAGVLGFGALDVTEQVVREADVLLALGCRFSQFTTRRWTLVGPDTQVIQVDVDAEELGRGVTPAVGLHGDAAATARALHACLDAGPRWEGRDDAARLQAIRAAYLEGSRVPLRDAADAGSGVCSAAVVRALREAMATHDPAFVLDATTFGIWMQRHLPVERAGSWFGNAGGAMGWGLPAAMGIKLARPHERVLAVVGDGSFWTVAQDLETAVREGIPVVCLVTNNFAYGNIRDRQRADHGGRLVGVAHDNPDFAAVARLLGAHGERVERADDLGPAVDRAFASGLPAVIDVIQDPGEGLPPGVRPPSTTEIQDA